MSLYLNWRDIISMNQNIIDSLEHNYMPYTAHVILQRALPEIDGFKPSQRRILYTMYNMNLLGKLRKKSQSIVGQTMFLHAHGDCLHEDTIVTMTNGNTKTIKELYLEGHEVEVL